MSKLKDAIYGLAVGDALGVPYEFKLRGTFKCTGMTGYGTWRQPAGTWSDDTAMTIATCDSIRECGRIDIDDIMTKFGDWIFDNDYTANGEVFDVGRTTQAALMRHFEYEMDTRHCGLSDEMDQGNGSLMRIIPLAFIDCDDSDIAAVSALTHSHPNVIEKCIFYVKVARLLIEYPLEPVKIKMKIKKSDVKSTGFVDDTLNAALWCLSKSEDYKSAVLKAVNLGGDTDTIAAVTGALAGIKYGYENIPEQWIDTLQNKELIDDCLF